MAMTGMHSIRYFIHLMRVAAIPNFFELGLIAHQTIRHLRNPKQSRGASEQSEMLLNEWYDGLEKGKAPYEIYGRNEYLAELWACWSVYSRVYLQKIESRKALPPFGIAGNICKGGLIVDLGNGIGITSAAFTEIFPHAEIVGTNLMQSAQGRICKMLSVEYGFRMLENTRSIERQADMAFASEYFEHFDNPIEHADEIVQSIRPKRMIVANAFTARAIGHFDVYRDNGQSFTGTQISKRFADAMRKMGYRKLKTGLFNDRPSVWELVK
jgi:2-polyprenyl-3-methyl-5-hydroxy-6-metoxy-1,4-benzoquinol methylase